jgi:hypothetical protein
LSPGLQPPTIEFIGIFSLQNLQESTGSCSVSGQIIFSARSEAVSGDKDLTELQCILPERQVGRNLPSHWPRISKNSLAFFLSFAAYTQSQILHIFRPDPHFSRTRVKAIQSILMHWSEDFYPGFPLIINGR